MNRQCVVDDGIFSPYITLYVRTYMLRFRICGVKVRPEFRVRIYTLYIIFIQNVVLSIAAQSQQSAIKSWHFRWQLCVVDFGGDLRLKRD